MFTCFSQYLFKCSLDLPFPKNPCHLSTLLSNLSTSCGPLSQELQPFCCHHLPVHCLNLLRPPPHSPSFGIFFWNSGIWPPPTCKILNHKNPLYFDFFSTSGHLCGSSTSNHSSSPLCSPPMQFALICKSFPDFFPLPN